MARAVTVEQAAEYLQLSPYTIRQWLRTGKLPGRKIGRVYRILDTDLEALVGARPREADAVRETAPEYQAAEPKRRTAKRKIGDASLAGKYAKLRSYGSLARVEGLSVESYLKAKREDQQRENDR